MSYLTALRQPIPWGRQFRDSLHYPHQLHLRNAFHNSNIFKIHDAVTILYLGRISHSHCTYAPWLTLAQYIHNADIMCRCWYHMLREAQKDSLTLYVPLLFRLVPLCWIHTASKCKLKGGWLDQQASISYLYSGMQSSETLVSETEQACRPLIFAAYMYLPAIRQSLFTDQLITVWAVLQELYWDYKECVGPRY